MGNGRCRVHGGKTPSGDGWHKILAPSKREVRGLKKFERKLAAKEKRDQLRVHRLATMTPEQREKFDDWQATYKPGAAHVRAQKKQERLSAKLLGQIVARADAKNASSMTASAAPMPRVALAGNSAAASRQLAYDMLADAAPSVMTEHVNRLLGRGYQRPSHSEFAKLLVPFVKAMQELGVDLGELDVDEMSAAQLQQHLPVLQAEIDRLETRVANRARLLTSDEVEVVDAGEIDVFG